jgi:hypothetical protein
VTLPPEQNVVGPEAVIVGVNAPTATLAVPVAVQPLLDTETFSVIGPVAAAVKVIAFVPCPLAIVAFVPVQLYEAPDVTTTLALPVAFAQTLAGAEIVALGAGLTVTVVTADVALQPAALVTVTV